MRKKAPMAKTRAHCLITSVESAARSTTTRRRERTSRVSRMQASPREPTLARSIEMLTPERVNISIDLASVGSRGLACILDTLLVLSLLLVVVLLAALSTLVIKQWALVFAIGAFFLIHWFYFAIFEAVWNGQTPGK